MPVDASLPWNAVNCLSEDTASSDSDESLSCPAYADLPEVAPGFPCSWNFFNALTKSKRDELGTLNFLTPERTARASAEIRTGRAISLNAEIAQFNEGLSAVSKRPSPVHKIICNEGTGHDSFLAFNTQSATQWDGLRHFGIRSMNVFYNAVTAKQIADSDVLGMQKWLTKGGINGRGVLIDLCSWWESQGATVDPNLGHAITLDEVQACLDWQRTSVLPGDVVLFRTGWGKWHRTCDPSERMEVLTRGHGSSLHHFIGLKSERRFVEWVWNCNIAAVAGDQVAFESTPPPEPEVFGWLHEHLLGALGCPIGELFDLEELSAACLEQDRWTFFFTSTPLHVKGGVASPANATAIL